jgi:hypothetical protein
MTAPIAPTSLDREVALRDDVAGVLARADGMRGMLQGCVEALVRHLDAAFAPIWILRPGRPSSSSAPALDSTPTWMAATGGYRSGPGRSPYRYNVTASR